jgi:Raf kinase inhibitor-like YbhB/YbcL family protein
MKNFPKGAWIALVLLAPLGIAQAQQGDGTNVAFQVHVFKPAKIEASPERIAQVKAPAGFGVNVFARGLKNARIVAVAADGTVYVSRREQGDVLMLKDANGDGRADGPPVTVANRPGAHALAIHDGKLYLATVKQVFVADVQPDGRLGPLVMIVKDLPDAGQHADRTVAFGPDGMLYISVGSTCNACNEDNPENATILRASPDGKSRTIFASGLRNTIGFDWQPVSGELWGLDNGIDFLGDDAQPEELNRIELGKQYGWPHIWGDGGVNPQSTPPGGISKAEWKAHSTPMTLGYTAHAAPMQLVFYRGASFPKEYQGDAFATMRGSWNRERASGYEIVHIRFKDGQPTAIDPFVTGFLTEGGTTHIARPVGLAVARDGALLMADDANGVIYRVAYEMGKAAGASLPTREPLPPATAMQKQAMKGVGVPLAMERPESAAKGTIELRSASFEQGGTIPLKHSEYADGVSPALSWKADPRAKSYALILEDPDAKPITPFVHWVIWNVPAGLTSLPEGLQKGPRLTEPDGVLQGRTSRGSSGYFGPRPPIGDPPHHYHFQLFALDAPLDVPAGSDRDVVLAAMRAHVLAKGELVGQFAQQGPPPAN